MVPLEESFLHDEYISRTRFVSKIPIPKAGRRKLWNKRTIQSRKTLTSNWSRSTSTCDGTTLPIQHRTLKSKNRGRGAETRVSGKRGFHSSLLPSTKQHSSESVTHIDGKSCVNGQEPPPSSLVCFKQTCQRLCPGPSSTQGPDAKLVRPRIPDWAAEDLVNGRSRNIFLHLLLSSIGGAPGSAVLSSDCHVHTVQLAASIVLRDIQRAHTSTCTDLFRIQKSIVSETAGSALLQLTMEEERDDYSVQKQQVRSGSTSSKELFRISTKARSNRFCGARSRVCAGKNIDEEKHDSPTLPKEEGAGGFWSLQSSIEHSRVTKIWKSRQYGCDQQCEIPPSKVGEDSWMENMLQVDDLAVQEVLVPRFTPSVPTVDLETNLSTVDYVAAHSAKPNHVRDGDDELARGLCQFGRFEDQLSQKLSGVEYSDVSFVF